jgi:hypothetical protein
MIKQLQLRTPNSSQQTNIIYIKTTDVQRILKLEIAFRIFDIAPSTKQAGSRQAPCTPCLPQTDLRADHVHPCSSKEHGHAPGS